MNIDEVFVRSLYFFLANFVSEPDERDLFVQQVSCYRILIPRNEEEGSKILGILVNNLGVAQEYLNLISNLLSSQGDRRLDKNLYSSEELFKDACFVCDHYQINPEMQYQII